MRSLIEPTAYVGLQLGTIQQLNTDGALDPLYSVLRALNSSARRGGFNAAAVHSFAKGEGNPIFALGEVSVTIVNKMAHRVKHDIQ